MVGALQKTFKYPSLSHWIHNIIIPSHICSPSVIITSTIALTSHQIQGVSKHQILNCCSRQRPGQQQRNYQSSLLLITGGFPFQRTSNLIQAKGIYLSHENALKKSSVNCQPLCPGTCVNLLQYNIYHKCLNWPSHKNTEWYDESILTWVWYSLD